MQQEGSLKRIAAVLVCLSLAGCYGVSEGEMAGQITYFTKRGFFCKTWEGQLIMGGLRSETHTNLSSDGKSTTSSTSMVANTVKFTVEDAALIPKIKAAFEAGQPIRLEYRKELVTFCRSDGDDNFVTAVR